MSLIWILLTVSIVIPVLLLLWMLRGSPHSPRTPDDRPRRKKPPTSPG